MIYLKTDALLIVDVYQRLRDMYLKHYLLILVIWETLILTLSVIKNTVNVLKLSQSAIRWRLLSVFGDCYFECKIRLVIAEYTGKRII